MPTKREMLEEKTVKELTEMAKEKELSGYSTLNKDGLIELIMDNYLKDEIKSWPEAEEEVEEVEEPEEEVETVEEKAKIEEEPKETPKKESGGIKPLETVEVEESYEEMPEPEIEEETDSFRDTIIIVTIILIIIIIAAVALSL